jgi:APA family basic amino acid/polyamine antiporter
MFVVWYLAMHNVWIFGRLGGMDEIVCAIIYLVYIAMYIYIMKNFKEYNVFKRFIMPAIAIIGSLFFTFCGTGLYQLVTTGSTSSLGDFGIFMALFAVLMFPCVFFYKKDKVKDLEVKSE